MKYFVVSDCHSFTTKMKLALSMAGFNKRNKEHTLIILGDIFDRGDEPNDMCDFILSIPKKRRILVKGNHELLYEELLKKSFPDYYDIRNGTVETFCKISNCENIFKESYYILNMDKYLDYDDYYTQCRKYWREEIIPKVKESKATKLILSNDWVYYYELKDFIFVHSFIPLKFKYRDTMSKAEYELSRPITYKKPITMFEYNENWRVAKKDELEDSTWGVSWDFFKNGLFDEEIKKNKTLVCGHISANQFHEVFEDDYSDNYEIYYSKNLIALDSCAVLSKKVNVLMIDENYNCYNQWREQLNIGDDIC